MVSTFQRNIWFPQINLLVQVYDTLCVKWDNIKYSLCLIWNRELNFQHLCLKRVPKPWGYWIFAGGLLCGFGFVFFLTGCIYPDFKWIPKQMGLVWP